jgi:hypothetical protein
VAESRRRVRKKLQQRKFALLLPRVLAHLLRDGHMVAIEEVIVEAEDMEVVDMAEIEEVAEGMGTEMIVLAPDLVVTEVALAIETMTVHQAIMEEVTMDHQVEEPPMIGNDQEAEVVIVKRVVIHLEGMEVVGMMTEEEVSRGEVNLKGDDMKEDEDHDHQREIVGGIKILCGDWVVPS